MWRFRLEYFNIQWNGGKARKAQSYKMREGCFSWNSFKKFSGKNAFWSWKSYFLKDSNQSRICCEGVGLGLFLSHSLESQSYEFIEIAHIGPYYVEWLENFVRIVWSFWENRKKSKHGCFLAIFGLILAMFLTFQSYDYDPIAHAGAPLGVKGLCKILWKSYGQFLRNLKFSWKVGRKKTEKTIRLRK